MATAALLLFTGGAITGLATGGIFPVPETGIL
jgi:hypothetical protein